MFWTSGLRIRPNMLHIAPLLAIAGLMLAGCSKDDEPTPGLGTTTFIGVAAGSGISSGISGSLSMTVGTATPAPTGTSRITRPARTVTATGTFTPSGGSAVSLTGTYDDENNALVVTGGGYSFTGLYVNGVISGAFTGPGPVDGTFAMQAATGGASTVRTYCGSYSSESGSAGTFNLAVGATTLTGVALGLNSDASIVLVGTRDVDDSIHVSVAGQPPLPLAEGKLSADGTTVVGVYDDQAGETGTFWGTLCSGTPGTTSFSGIAAGHGEAGALSLTVSTASPRPARADRATVTASGIYEIQGHATVNLTGTYDTGTNLFSLSGGGYSFTGVYASANRQEGTWTSETNSGEWVTTTSGEAVHRYCGTFNSTTSTAAGRVGLVLNGGVAMGVAVPDEPTDSPIPLDGIVAGSTVTIYFPGTTNVFATGTIATGGATISGHYDFQDGEMGDWSASLCPAPLTLTARAWRP